MYKRYNSNFDGSLKSVPLIESCHLKRFYCIYCFTIYNTERSLIFDDMERDLYQKERKESLIVFLLGEEFVVEIDQGQDGRSNGQKKRKDQESEWNRHER